jgi:RNA-binding protein NOB1
MATEKLIHTVVLDTGPIIKGDPSISTLLAQSEQLVTLPSVIQEIRDEATRTRLQTTLLPFLILKSPKESSIKIISDFARRTGDLSVLSRVDIHLLALTYDLECERNGGDWRLRKTPGEKRINGANPNAIPKSDPVHNSEPQQDQSSEQESDAAIVVASEQVDSGSKEVTQERDEPQSAEVVVENSVPLPAPEVREAETNSDHDEDDITTSIDAIQLSDVSQNEDSSDSDSEGWITPSNLKKKQEEDLTGDTSADPEPKVLQVVSADGIFSKSSVY